MFWHQWIFNAAHGIPSRRQKVSSIFGRQRRRRKTLHDNQCKVCPGPRDPQEYPLGALLDLVAFETLLGNLLHLSRDQVLIRRKATAEFQEQELPSMEEGLDDSNISIVFWAKHFHIQRILPLGHQQERG